MATADSKLDAPLSVERAKAQWCARWPLNEATDGFWRQTIVAHAKLVPPELLTHRAGEVIDLQARVEGQAIISEMRKEFEAPQEERGRGNPEMIERRARAQCVAEFTAWATKAAPVPETMALAEIVLGLERECRKRGIVTAADEWKGRLARLKKSLKSVSVATRVLEERETRVHDDLAARERKRSMSLADREAATNRSIEQTNQWFDRSTVEDVVVALGYARALLGRMHNREYAAAAAQRFGNWMAEEVAESLRPPKAPASGARKIRAAARRGRTRAAKRQF